MQAGLLKSRRNMQHGDLHDVCSGALDGSVDGLALLTVLESAVELALQGGEVTAAAEQRFDVAVLGRLLANAIEVFLDARELAEIGLYKLLRFGQGELSGTREAKRGHAVDQAEVDGLGMTTHILGDLIQWNTIDGGSGGGVNVLPGAEGGQHGLIFRHVCNDTQFDLGVIDREQDGAFRSDEAIANAATFLGADGNVLEIGIGGG